jgi:hypothetical protein
VSVLSSIEAMSKAASALKGAPIALGAIREDGKAELKRVLQENAGDKCLVLDASLGSPLNHILVEGSQLLKDHGVRDFKKINGDAIATACEQVVFLVRPILAQMRLVARQIRSMKVAAARDGTPKTYAVHFVPRKTIVCEALLKKELDSEGNKGTFKELEREGRLKLGDCHLDLIPLDGDVLTLELDGVFTDCYQHGDTTSLWTVARSVARLQVLFGTVRNVKAKGVLSLQVLDLVQRFRREERATAAGAASSAGGAEGGTSDIDTLVLIDRGVDLVTPLLTPLTYEALIDDIIGIECGYVKLDPSVLDASAEAPAEGSSAKPITQPLNSNDTLYAELRDFHDQRLGPHLQAQMMEVQEQHETFRAKKGRAQDLGDLRSFVRKIPALKKRFESLNVHINVAEHIKKITGSPTFRARWNLERSIIEGDAQYEQIEEMLATQEPVVQVLRVMCLQSLCNGGIKTKQFDNLRRELLQTYGFELLFTLNTLERLGMLRRKETSWVDTASPWDAIRKAMRLIKEDVDVMNPDDIAYVTSGYAPLSCRLVEAAMRPGGWSSEAVKLVPGPIAELQQTLRPAPAGTGGVGSGSAGGGGGGGGSGGAAAAGGSGVGGAAGAAGATETGAAEQVYPETTVGANGRKVMMVYFIGGVTYMEISALRHISSQPDCACRRRRRRCAVAAAAAAAADTSTDSARCSDYVSQAPMTLLLRQRR